ncbi:Arm DNA-binding domain-containing protein, partial [Thermovirga sp.]|uniref:tyrosine-type recombinase/integrase n=1 Tax=Thermovirga sp. TaxID=2699834 RepID=UPI0025D776C1
MSDLKIRALKPKEKSYTVRDGRGLYLEVTPKGSKLWRIRIWQNGREIKRSLGRYPDVSLREARLKRDEILLARDKGVNILASPNKLETFQEIALDWYSRKMEGVRSDNHAARVLSRLQRYVFPAIGHKHINEIRPPEI